jgi:hypothetical protein
MSIFRTAGRPGFACGMLALGLLAGSSLTRAADRFPFGQTLMLDAAPMLPVKRVPILTVEENGEATIGLWCKTVRARAELSDGAMRIEPGPLPEDLPPYMVDGQCTDERMNADQGTLAALAQVNGWRREGGAIVLTGATPLKFRPSSN